MQRMQFCSDLWLQKRFTLLQSQIDTVNPASFFPTTVHPSSSPFSLTFFRACPNFSAASSGVASILLIYYSINRMGYAHRQNIDNIIIEMNKHLLRLIYLARQAEAPTFTTQNIHLFVNRIPCDEDYFQQANPAESHVIRQLQEYPIAVEGEEEAAGEEEGAGLFSNEKMLNIYRKVEEFTMDFSYLPIQEARLYLQALDKEEISEHKESLSQIRQLMADTLSEEQLNDYAIQEIENFLQELKETEGKASSRVV